eukprot:TRINITY_DN3624_c0_g1_i2.p1 TRINITY_DN3624_c0_g1~~TRINITY_DN3624_c0_g1_i2.p1  ORF type:complete len:288 (+),score=69.84 TRINITY_DN3624_c0_g1_i2:272-1135(+)
MKKTRGVVIGYDGRHHSLRFAQLAAATFISQGILVYLFSRLVPTPFVSFATPHLKCVAGVMVTASHNPKDDNGYKVYWESGCQINVPHDKGILQQIDANLAPWDIHHDDLLAKSKDSLLKDPIDEVSAAYFEKVGSTCCFHQAYNASSKVPITYTAMHGVGAEWVARSFATFNLPPYIPVPEQISADPEFPTVEFPNPEEGQGALKLAMAAAEAHASPLILATDPDADRLAVAEKVAGPHETGWRIFTGNEIGAFLAYWLWQKNQASPDALPPAQIAMVNSTVSSKV